MSVVFPARRGPQTMTALGGVESRILEGKDAALRDPSNHYPGEEGYMTMRGKSGAMTIPEEWFDE